MNRERLAVNPRVSPPPSCYPPTTAHPLLLSLLLLMLQLLRLHLLPAVIFAEVRAPGLTT